MERFENRQSRKEELKSRMISTAGPVIPEEQSEREEDAAKKSRKSVSGFGRRFRPVFIALAVFFALAAIWQLYIRFYRYRDYTVTQVRDITVGSTVGFAGFGGGILYAPSMLLNLTGSIVSPVTFLGSISVLYFVSPFTVCLSLTMIVTLVVADPGPMRSAIL